MSEKNNPAPTMTAESMERLRTAFLACKPNVDKEETVSKDKIPVPTTATERVERLRKAFLTYKPNIDIERAVFMYDLYESGVLDNLSPAMVKAKLLDNLLQRKTIYIEDDQLVAGTFGSRPRAMPVYPESNGKTMINEFRKAPTREIDPFEYSEEDRVKLEYVLNNMKPIPELRRVFYDELPMDMKRLFLKEPEKNYTVNTQICSMDGVINGPGGHINPDFERVINYGFDYIIREAEVRRRQAEAEGDTHTVEFLNSAIICMEAAGKFAERHAEVARKLAEKETNEKRKNELLRMAETCSRVPMKPARTFYECIQSTWLLFVIIMLEGSERCYSVARFDQYAYPYLQADLDSGRITQSEAQEMLDCFWMKFTETSHFNSESFTKSIAGFAPQQQFVCGGQTRDGKDATNLLSYMQLQASINTRYAQPSISVRIWEGTPDALIEKACELARLGTGHPSFFNDRVIVPGLNEMGIMIEDARDYGIVGCSSVQPTKRDKGAQNGGYINLGACLEMAMHNGYWKRGDKVIGPNTGDARNFSSYEQFESAFKAQYANLIEKHSKATVINEQVQRKYNPTPFLSCMVGDCITRGRDRSDGGAFYNNGISARSVGFADVVDSLAAIKKLVFEDKAITMSELIDACDANWEGYDNLLKLVKEAPKYGRDDDYADQIGVDLTRFYTKEAKKYHSLFGGEFYPGFSTVSANVFYGQVVAATPSGRKDFEPLTDGVSPEHHCDINGPTAAAISAGKLNHKGMTGGSILNLRFSPQTVAGEEGLEHLVQFVKGAVETGIWHMQFNVNDVQTLRDAQKHPEKYQDLLVRVAGYSALFTALPENLQNDIIDRTVHSLCC